MAYCQIKSKEIYQPENLMINGSSRYTVGGHNYFTKMAAISWLVEYMHREK